MNTTLNLFCEPITALRGARNLAVQPRTISASVRRAPCAAFRNSKFQVVFKW